jgi:hypothetical protein
MTIPDERVGGSLSIPTQTGLKGLRDLAKISPCRTATQRNFRNRFRGFLKLEHGPQNAKAVSDFVDPVSSDWSSGPDRAG